MVPLERQTRGEALLELLLIELGDGNLRTEGRRAFREAVAAFSDSESDGWWRWTVESLASLGKKAKVIDGSTTDALMMIDEGAALVLHAPDDGDEWLAVVGRSGRRFTVIDEASRAVSRRVTRRSLKSALQRFATADGRVRFVALEPGFGRHPGQESIDGHVTPFERLRALLQPESSDILTVCIYALIVGLLTLATPIAVEALVNTVAFGRFLQPVIVLALLLFMFLAFSAAIRAVQTIVVEIVQRRLFARVAGDLAYRLPRVQMTEMDGAYAPELVNRFFDVVTVQKVSAQLLLEGLGLVLSAAVGMAVLAFYHPWLAGFDLALILMIIFVVFVLGRGAVKSSIKESKKKYAMAAWLEDLARCPVAFRTDGGSEFALERADRMIHDYLTARRKHFRILMRQILFALGLQAVASTALLGIGGWLVVSGELTLGQLVAAELIVAVIVGSVAKLGKHMESFYDLLAAVDKLGHLFDLNVERPDGVIAPATAGPARLELTRLSSSSSSLDQYDWRIDAGELVAVLGNAGTGKSRLCDVIYGLRTPEGGHLTIDGNDPRDLRPDVLRRRVALAREIEFFEGTIAENVHLERPSVSSADVNSMLDRLGVLDELVRLPDGLGTLLPACGGQLSSSQLRRLMLARSIVGRPGLLLIDGLLDGFSDAELQEVGTALAGLSNECTILIATGQQRVAALCERVLWMDVNAADSEVGSQMGTHS
ncbi:MAG: ATP-binding cassette domain-containing protein [Planctomycetota bacterium]|jgi:ABC-type bacteriocin/lantibiotic exporter with double-glycine peptidase domain